MVINIGSLPTIRDIVSPPGEIIEPLYTILERDIAFDILQGEGFQNQISSVMNTAKADLTSALGVLNDNFAGAGPTRIATLQADLLSGPAFALRGNLVSSLDSVAAMQPLMTDTLSQATNFLNHTDLMAQNIPAIDSIINNTLTLPFQIPTDILGGLPTSFPGVPDFSTFPANFPNLDFAGLPVPSFGGFDASNLAGLADIGGILEGGGLSNIAGIAGIGSLAGVNLPGIPIPGDVLQGFAGSMLSADFGGLGGLMSGNLSSMASGFLGGNSISGLGGITDIAGQMGGLEAVLGDAGALQGLAGGFIGDVGPLAALMEGPGGLGGLAGLGGMAEGLEGIIGGELGALQGAGCMPIIAGGGCGSLPSALANASTMVDMSQLQESAQLLASTLSETIAEKFGGFAGLPGVPALPPLVET